MQERDSKLILIIEDDLALAKMYSEKFQTEKFETLVATDGETGLKLALDKIPDFILLDMMLPKMSGQTVLEKLREHPIGKSIPVISLTNLTEKDQAHKAIKSGVKEYLAKPMHTPEEVVEKVKLHLGIF